MASKSRTVLLGLLCLSAVYLYAWPVPTLFYEAVVVLHLLAGILLTVQILFIPAWQKLFRKACTPVQGFGWTLVISGGVLGLLLIFTGARHEKWILLYAHILLSVLGIVFLLASWAGRRGWLGASPSAVALRVVLAFFIVAGVSAAAWWLRTVPWERGYLIQNPPLAPASMDAEGDGASGPFFPSSAQTAGGIKIPSSYFTESDACERCHSDIYREWQSSAHHFSSFNNQWYRRSIEYMQDVAGVRSSKWCAGCHDPALLFSGKMDIPIREIVHTPEAQAGMGCMMCHSIARVKSTMGQGDFLLEYPLLHRFAESKNPFLRHLHDFLIELNPEPHRRVFLKPFMRQQTAQFCSTCHKVHLDVPVNRYRWVRGFNEYDNWQASAVSGEGARSFYYPATPQQCADCHMPLVKSRDAGNVAGEIHSHRFLAANTALPFENDDATQFADTENFLQDNQVSVDIFAISPETPSANPSAPLSASVASGLQLSTAFGVGEEAETNPSSQTNAPPAPVTAPLNRVSATVRRGDLLRADVVVRTRKVGHFFPGGTVDAFDCWLELRATDETGRVIFWSGGLENPGGPVDPAAHFYRSLLIDAHGNAINKRNAWAERAVVYVHLIPPGAADTVHYRLRIPENAGDRIHLTARLNYRKFSWWNTHFSFAGMRDPAAPNPNVTPDFDDGRWIFSGDTSDVSGKFKSVPELPVVVMAQDEVDLNIAPKVSTAPAPQISLRAEDWQRWNDYGIGLFLQGDLKAAEAAFAKITEIDPKNPDGWVNMGRARIAEGNLEGAQQVLEKALALSPTLARAHFFLAKALRDEGEYVEAMEHLRTVLWQYPRDRVARDDLGRILFLAKRYADASREFQATLAIDPEDLEANYNLMLCSTGLGDAALARQYETRYLRFKADESAESLTGPYLRSHPEDNLERQPIHEHTSMPLEKTLGSPARARDSQTGGGQ